MKNYKLLLLAIVAVFAFSCEEEKIEAPGTNYVTFEKDRTLEVTPDGTSSFEVLVYTANVKGSDRTFNFSILDESTADPATYTMPTSVTVPGGSNVGVIPVSVTDVNLNLATAQTIVIQLQGEDGLSVGEPMTLSLLEQCLFTKVVFNISFDSWPEEVYWAIYDGNTGLLVTENGPYSPYNNAYAGLSGSLSSTLCLEDGDYLFFISDDYCDGAGPASLSTLDGTTLFSTNGGYGCGTSAPFSLP